MKLFSKKPKNQAASLEELLSEAKVPHFSRAVMQLLRLLRNPESETEEIVQIAQWDPNLVLKMLRTVNSAAYGIRHQITSVPQAVAFLGRGQMESLVLGLAVRNALPEKASPSFDSRRFWETAGWRASLSRLLATRLHPGEADDYFLYGFLQDVSLPILAQAIPDQYDALLGEWLDHDGTSLQELERESFGWDHCEAGARLANHWELPEKLRLAICDHHDHESGAQGRVAVDLVAYLRESDVDTGVELLQKQAVDRYQLPQPWVEDAIRQAQEEGKELAELLE